ncbi:unnamed protein product [Brassicogethes aeneus]|uniref:OCIA domain-containing protein n=1 Tax=Brassicogethes aeneus TaxID=1431903 RepID=A0A9P0AKJ5_BRAAE|nr:unnamed protein product [Brassicogethes aeneus]
MNPNQNDPYDKDETRPFPGPNRQRPQQYKFSAEELRVIKECNEESFYQRCLPMSGLLAGSMYYGVKAGYLAPSQRFGAVPKVAMGVFLGYFLGKFSYQTKCAEKLMQLPNSKVGEMLRQRRRGNIQESDSFGPGMALSPFSSIPSPNDTYSDLNPRNSLDMDTSRPQNDGLDESQRPSLDNPIYDEEMPPVKPNYKTSYEELRKQNREEYQQKRTGTYGQANKPPYTSAPRASDSESIPTYKPTNKYGDDFE